MAACNNAPHNVPFPQQGSEFIKPVTEKLVFSEPKKLNWVHVSPDSVKPIERKIDFNKIPSRPIDMGIPKPLTSLVKDTIFNLDNIASDTAFNFAKMPVKQLTFKTAILGKPKRVKSGSPRLKDGASDAILLFGQDQGLPGTIGQSFMQDKNGIMWIATDNGICRFDGEYCEIYSIAQGLNYSWITSLMEDSKGQIWLSYNGGFGLSVLDTKKGIIKHLTVAGGLSNKNVQKTMEDNQGRIWVATNRGINIIDEKAGTIKNIVTTSGSNNYFVSDLLLDNSDRIWFGAPGWGVGIIDTKKETLKRFGTSQGLGTPGVSRLMQDMSGQIWIGTFGGDLKIINEKQNTIKRISGSIEFGNVNIRGIAYDKNGKAWIGTYGSGVKLYDPESETIKSLSTGEGLSNDNVFSVFADKQGQIWIGTNGGEVNIYNTNGGSLHHLNGTRGLSNNTSFIYGFTEDSLSRYWLASGGVIDIIDEKKGTLKSLGQQQGFANGVNNLFTDSRGRVWTGTNDEVNIIDEKTGTIKQFSTANGLTFFGQGSFVEDSKGQVWIGRGGVYVINENAGTIKYIRSAQGLTSNVIECIIKDRKGQTWIGTASGVEIIDENDGTVKHITAKGLNNITVFNIIEDKTGKIWMATFGNGLFMIDQDAGTITNFSVNNGLEDMAVYTVNERNGSVYAGTGRGVNIVRPANSNDNKTNEPSSWEIKSYGKPQGFLRVDHNPRSMLSKDGRLWWGIADVLTIMDEPVNDSLVPTSYVTALNIMEQSYDFTSSESIKTKMLDTDTIWNTARDTFYTKNNFPADSDYLKKNKIHRDSVAGPYNMPANLSLPHKQNHLTFFFTGSHLDNLNKTRYRYMLEGNDETWSDITDKAFADYRNLSIGRYTFKVSSRGFNGKWSKPAEFSFKITPPWWQTSLAYMAYGILFFVALSFFIRWRTAAVKKENLVLEKKVALRTDQLKKEKEKVEDTLTNLKSTQEQLVQQEKMASLGELTAGIAHEIQNPLNFVNNFSEVNSELITEMKQEIDKGNLNEVKTIADSIDENEKKIIFHGKRADSIVKGMLQHSRSSNGLKEPADINALCDEYLRLSYHGLRAKEKSFNANLKTDFDETIGNINIVSQDIGRVVLNLINNAFYVVDEKKKQHPTGYEPTVSVSTKKINARPDDPVGRGKVEIKVADNGNGIPQKVLDKIFQPFFTTKPTGQGTGLGLSLSYDIVKAHGGELRVETKEGEGSEFIIQLPIS
jgi:signal transduction histidine kinase/streptogramin lyase